MPSARLGHSTKEVNVMKTNALMTNSPARMISIETGGGLIQFPAPSQDVIDRVVDRNGDFLLGACCVAAGVLLGVAIANAR